MITNVLNRVALFAINSSMGVITFMPNIMMGDSGTAGLNVLQDMVYQLL